MSVISSKIHISRKASRSAGFTMIEAVVAIALIGLGISSTIGALTKINSIAAMSRNSTGAETVVQNEIDKFLSYSPFNPQKMNPPPNGTVLQVPKDPNNNPPTYDLTIGTHIIDDVPVYRESTTGVIVKGKLTTVVADISPSTSIPMYRATVTLEYWYLGRKFTLAMSTVRGSDT